MIAFWWSISFQRTHIADYIDCRPLHYWHKFSSIISHSLLYASQIIIYISTKAIRNLLIYSTKVIGVDQWSLYIYIYTCCLEIGVAAIPFLLIIISWLPWHHNPHTLLFLVFDKKKIEVSLFTERVMKKITESPEQRISNKRWY
jgi:hypothetical protein